MCAWAYSMGHKVIFENDKWVYDDTKEVVKKSSRVCASCNLTPTEDGHDPCIANLPGVIHACCGHGVENGYVMFENGTVIRGAFDHIKKEVESNKSS